MAVITLTGFMGSGKTTYGKAAAARCGCRFLDLDDEMVRICGKSIPEIFKDGEQAFRAVEKDCLERVLADIPAGQTVLLALGGGTVTNQASAAVLKEMTHCIYLKGSATTLRHNLEGQTVERPLLKSGNFDSLLASRLGIYASAADVTIDTDGMDGEDVIERIAEIVRRRSH